MLLATGHNAAAADGFPITGTFTVDEFAPFRGTADTNYLGVISINAKPLRKVRLIAGSKPRRLADGRVLYRRPCGQFVHQIMLANSDLKSKPLTPCSSELPNSGVSPTNFTVASLSSDGSLVAVEATYYPSRPPTKAQELAVSVGVFDTSTQELVTFWNGAYNPLWLPDGRLILCSNEGLKMVDKSLKTVTAFGEDINGPVGNPSLHPNGLGLLFEYNQQIWGANIDGTDARMMISAGGALRFPTWAPDGSLKVAYLEASSGENYHPGIAVTDLATNESSVLDLRPVLHNANHLTRTINGPLSWTQ